MPRFFFDVLDGDVTTEDREGVEFADCETALKEAVRGARECVAHGIMRGEDLSGQCFAIRDEHGEIAKLPFRSTLPGRLRA